MRYAVLSDIHANLAAFKAVLTDIEDRGGVDKIWCLGDIVDYGPEPRECIALLRETNHVSVAGNHDLAVVDKADINLLNPDAAHSCRWTIEQLTPEDREFLIGLPVKIEEEGFTMVHASPREPTWEYLISSGVARENFPNFKTQFCLVGHSHVPMVFSHSEEEGYSSGQFLPEVRLSLGKSRLIINPGSVGQPRDGDPRASYAIYDSEKSIAQLYRVPYNIREIQDKIVSCGLPLRLMTRLAQGI